MFFTIIFNKNKNKILLFYYFNLITEKSKAKTLNLQSIISVFICLLAPQITQIRSDVNLLTLHRHVFAKKLSNRLLTSKPFCFSLSLSYYLLKM